MDHDQRLLEVTPSGLTFVPVLFNDEMEKIGVHVLTAENGMTWVAFPPKIYLLCGQLLTL